jgi:hypothetical protein
VCAENRPSQTVLWEGSSYQALEKLDCYSFQKNTAEERKQRRGRKKERKHKCFPVYTLERQ